jgi:hypothetical protein
MVGVQLKRSRSIRTLEALKVPFNAGVVGHGMEQVDCIRSIVGASLKIRQMIADLLDVKIRLH